jgi:hypothetical protein
MPRTYIQSNSHEGARQLRDVFHKLDLSFTIKPEKTLDIATNFLSNELVSSFTGCIEKQHFENSLCIYLDFLLFIREKAIHEEIITCDELIGNLASFK